MKMYGKATATVAKTLEAFGAFRWYFGQTPAIVSTNAWEPIADSLGTQSCIVAEVQETLVGNMAWEGTPQPSPEIAGLMDREVTWRDETD